MLAGTNWSGGCFVWFTPSTRLLQVNRDYKSQDWQAVVVLRLRPPSSMVEMSLPYSFCHSKTMLMKLLAADLEKEGHPVTGESLSTSRLVTVFPKVVQGSSSSSPCSTQHCRALETKQQLDVRKASLLPLSGVEVSIRLINCCTAQACFPHATYYVISLCSCPSPSWETFLVSVPVFLRTLHCPPWVRPVGCSRSGCAISLTSKGILCDLLYI